MYGNPCTTLQHKQCERLGHCVEPYLSESRSKRYFKLCRRITFRVIKISSAYGTKEFMTINPNIKFLGTAIRKREVKDENERIY